jgi:hypothetical protein
MFSHSLLFAELRRKDLLVEAERERLAAQVRRPASHVRHELAVACYRLADWIDNPNRYLQPSESGLVDWGQVR